MTHEQWLKEIKKKYFAQILVWEDFWPSFWDFPDSNEELNYTTLMSMALSK